MEAAGKAIPSSDPQFVGGMIRNCYIQLLEDGYALRTFSLGGSMPPTIREGDMLTVMPATLGDLRIGDILAFRPNKSHDVLTVHRVIKRGVRRGKPWVVTMGDAKFQRDQTTADPLRDPATVLGRVVRIEKSAGGATVDLRSFTQRWRGILRAKYSVLRSIVFDRKHRLQRHLRRILGV